jgi:hypothetical protein
MRVRPLARVCLRTRAAASANTVVAMVTTLELKGAISTSVGHFRVSSAQKKSAAERLGCGALKSEHRGTLFAKVRGKPYGGR